MGSVNYYSLPNEPHQTQTIRRGFFVTSSCPTASGIQENPSAPMSGGNTEQRVTL